MELGSRERERRTKNDTAPSFLQSASTDQLAATKTALEAWLASPDNAAAVADAAALPGVEGETAAALRSLSAALAVHAAPPPAAPLRERLNVAEAELASARRSMRLGYTDPASDAFVEASTVQLRTLLRTAPDEATRRAAYEGLRSIGPFVAARFCDIVKLRGQLATAAGYGCYYDMKVQAAEGMTKKQLFEFLDALEARTRPLAERAAAQLSAAKGDAAWAPWNRPAALSGDADRAMDPYFQFTDAVGAWARSFAALGITYRGGTVRLDLLDRPLKYSNGFCHWSRLAYLDTDGVWHPATAQLTSLADPGAIGSGRTALTTLMHECGHAAHFANCVDVRTPLASQERAPTSVAVAETQSMTLDSLCDDAAWMARYARDSSGKPIPWPLIEAKLRDGHPYSVLAVRAMLSVPYFEKRVYELSEADLTPENVLAIADEVETWAELGPSPRPLLSVPHPMSDESAGYYHAYLMAEAAVFHTRAAFKTKFGDLVDNPAVGRALADGYWRHGNTKPFGAMVADVCGTPLSVDAWVAELETPLEVKLAEEKNAYDAAIAAGPALPPGADAGAALDVRVIIAHGDETVADTETDGWLGGVEAKFGAWLEARAKASA